MTTTHSTLHAYVGKRGLWSPPSTSNGRICFVVEIIDARPRFGDVDLLIRPVAGQGQKWVSLSAVNFHLDNER